MMPPPPPEPPGGQDDPVDPRTFAHAAIRLLRDVADRLDPESDHELRERVRAFRRAAIRLYDELGQP